MKAMLFALVLALSSSCYVAGYEPDYGVCLGPVEPSAFCDAYFHWMPGGYYVLRPEYRMRWHHRRARIERHYHR